MMSLPWIVNNIQQIFFECLLHGRDPSRDWKTALNKFGKLLPMWSLSSRVETRPVNLKYTHDQTSGSNTCNEEQQSRGGTEQGEGRSSLRRPPLSRDPGKWGQYSGKHSGAPRLKYVREMSRKPEWLWKKHGEDSGMWSHGSNNNEKKK